MCQKIGVGLEQLSVSKVIEQIDLSTVIRRRGGGGGGVSTISLFYKLSLKARLRLELYISNGTGSKKSIFRLI